MNYSTMGYTCIVLIIKYLKVFSQTLYIADRENKRIQIFDQEGNLLRIWTHIGSPYGLYLTPEQEIFLTDGVADQILKLDLSGNIIGRYGASGKAAGQFSLPHGIIETFFKQLPVNLIS